MRIICAYLGALLATWLIQEGKRLGYVDADSNIFNYLATALGVALADDYQWLVDWLQKLKDKTTGK